MMDKKKIEENFAFFRKSEGGNTRYRGPVDGPRQRTEKRDVMTPGVGVSR